NFYLLRCVETSSMTRIPAEVRSTRISPLARLPAFFALEGKRVVVAGGSQAAAWKADLLSAAGPPVAVFAPAFGEEMIALAADPPHGAVTLHDHAWTTNDLAGAAIAVADCTDEDEARKFSAAARS